MFKSLFYSSFHICIFHFYSQIDYKFLRTKSSFSILNSNWCLESPEFIFLLSEWISEWMHISVSLNNRVTRMTKIIYEINLTLSHSLKSLFFLNFYFHKSFLAHEYPTFLHYFLFPWKRQVERVYILSLTCAATTPSVEKDKIQQYNQSSSHHFERILKVTKFCAPVLLHVLMPMWKPADRNAIISRIVTFLTHRTQVLLYPLLKSTRPCLVHFNPGINDFCVYVMPLNFQNNFSGFFFIMFS